MASQYRRRSLMLNTIAKVAQGNPTIITDSSSRRLKRLDIFGQSEQDSTTGKNLLNPTGATKSGWNIALPNFKLEIGKTYTYTAPSTLTGSKAAGLYTMASDTQLATCLTVGKTATFTVPEEADLSQGILLAGGSADSLVLGDELTAMVELGSVATEFEPFTGGKPSPSPDYQQEIISKEVNEIKVTGSNILPEDDKSFTTNSFYICRNNGFKLKANTKYILNVSQVIDGFYIEKFGSQNEHITFVYNDNKLEYTPTEDMTVYFQAYTIKSTDFENTGFKMWLNVDIAKEYEPYKSQTITFPEPITLRGIPVSSGGNVTIDGQQYISDVICEKDGVVGVERNLNEVLVSSLGSTKLTQAVHTNGQNYLSCHTGNAKRRIKPMSNRYIGNTYTMKNNYVYVPSTEGFVITDSRFIDKETAISIITEEQTKVVYVLETQTFEPLPEEIQAQYKALKSYYPNTVIQTGCWNEVTYSAKRGG